MEPKKTKGKAVSKAVALKKLKTHFIMIGWVLYDVGRDIRNLFNEKRFGRKPEIY